MIKLDPSELYKEYNFGMKKVNQLKPICNFDKLINECRPNKNGFIPSYYRGNQEKTNSGQICQKWTSQTPHK